MTRCVISELVISYCIQMKKLYILLCFCSFFVIPRVVLAELETGKWNFVLENEYCYIGSFPITEEIPEGKKRGDTYILVYRMNKSPDAIVQINAGYPYDEKKSVEGKIDSSIYNFFSKEDSAWTNEDKKVIYAMKKGIKLIVKGYSSRGTPTTDTYTLKGFTTAYSKLTKDC